MNLILIIIYIIENIYICFRYYKKNTGIFTPVFILSMMSLGQILPQLTTIYFQDRIYSPNLIPDLAYTMITCNAAFVIGWKIKTFTPRKYIKTIDFKKNLLIYLITIFSICSAIFTHILKAGSNIIDGVIAFQFQGLGFLGLILAIIYICKYNNSKWVIFCMFLSTIPIIEYALSIYGSRQSIFTVALLYAYLAFKKRPAMYPLIKKTFLVFFIIGMIGSMSISEVRNSMHSEKGYLNGIENIEFIQNIKTSFTNSYHEGAGMDLGNAALAIKRCKETDQYNYGLFLWNGFVFNYIPRRLVGEDFKNSLMVNEEMNKYIDQITHGITCTTGYYDAFSSFSYLGFIIFFFLARLMLYIKEKATYSSFFEMLYLFVLVNCSVAITHGLQLAFAKIEFVLLLFILLFFTLRRKTFARKKHTV